MTEPSFTLSQVRQILASELHQMRFAEKWHKEHGNAYDEWYFANVYHYIRELAREHFATERWYQKNER